MQIIDAHTHPRKFIAKRKLSLRRTSEEDKTLSPLESANLHLTQMDRAGVSISALLGYDVLPGLSAESVSSVNDFTRDVVREAPGRFFGLCFINPALSESIVAGELDRCLSIPEFLGIKLELDVNCRDRRLDLVMQKAIEYGVPVLHHAWYLNPWEAPDDKNQQNRSEPRDVADLARRFPSATIIMAHMEGSNIRGILDIAELGNVCVDTSGSQPFSGTLEFGLKELGRDRILFGSDFFIRGLASQMGRILGTPLSQADREAVLFKNARRIFNLASSEIRCATELPDALCL